MTPWLNMPMRSGATAAASRCGLAFVSSDHAKALQDFEQALKINPRSLPALQNKAHIYGKYLQRTEEAVLILDEAIRLYPDDLCLRAGRGTLLARLGKRPTALK